MFPWLPFSNFTFNIVRLKDFMVRFGGNGYIEDILWFTVIVSIHVELI